MREKTTVRELLKREIDIDVYDDVCEELGIAFCGPLKLTPYAEEKFGSVLDLGVTIVDERGYPSYAIVSVDGMGWTKRLATAKGLFESAAGFCSCDEYKKLFEEVE